MSSSIEKALLSLVQIVTLTKRPFPDPRSLSGYRPTLLGLSRDEKQIVMQLDGGLDGGDSAHRTGVLGFCNSEVDINNLGLFMLDDGLMTRHPNQYPWNNPNNSSRDQLIGYIAGCWRAERFEIVRSLLRAHTERDPPYTCQNFENDAPGTVKKPPIGDLLGPQNIMYFRICAGDYRASLDIVSQLALYIEIVTASTSKDKELNQILLHAIVCGQLDIFLEAHKNYAEQLHYYWSGDPWRGQKAIANSLVDVINIEIARYSTPSLLDFLLPQHLLEELRNLDLVAELKAFISGNPLVFAELAGRFILAGLRDLKDHIEMLVRIASTLDAISREFVGALIKTLRHAAADGFKQLTELIDKSFSDLLGFQGTFLKIAASILGFDTQGGTDDDELAFRIDVRKSLQQIAGNTEKTVKAIAELQTLMDTKFSELTETIKEGFYQLVLKELIAETINSRILLETYENEEIDESGRERLFQQIDALRKKIIESGKYGSETLSYCFHAYAVLVSLLSLIGDRKKEIKVMREELGETVFQPLLYGENGPISQLLKLAEIETLSEGNFVKRKTKTSIGVKSEQQYEILYTLIGPNGPVHAKKPLNQFLVTVYFSQIDGNFEDTVSIHSIELPSIEFKDYLIPIRTRDELRKIVPDLDIAEEAEFVVFQNNVWQGGDVNISNATAAFLSNGKKDSQKILDARRIRPNLEALSTGIRTSLSI